MTILVGVATFCRSSVTPLRAEEGLTGALAPANDGVGLTGECHTHFSTEDEVCEKEIDTIDRAIFRLICPTLIVKV